jgi:hypothetical protein
LLPPPLCVWCTDNCNRLIFLQCDFLLVFVDYFDACACCGLLPDTVIVLLELRAFTFILQVPTRCAALLTASLLITTLQACEGARILGLFPLSGRSHAIVHFSLVKELAKRGHQVTVLSPFPQQSAIPNYTDIAIREIAVEELLNMSGENVPLP